MIMTAPVSSNSISSTPISLSIESLSLGQLCAQERAKLVNAILSNPETAALAKLGLRVAIPAQQTASCIVAAANSHSKSNKGWWNARNLVTGACASFALLAVFSFSNQTVQTVEPGRVAMSQAHLSDQFGPAGSFEGVAGMGNLELVDRFGGGGFEAD